MKVRDYSDTAGPGARKVDRRGGPQKRIDLMPASGRSRCGAPTMTLRYASRPPKHLHQAVRQLDSSGRYVGHKRASGGTRNGRKPRKPRRADGADGGRRRSGHDGHPRRHRGRSRSWTRRESRSARPRSASWFGPLLRASFPPPHRSDHLAVRRQVGGVIFSITRS